MKVNKINYKSIIFYLFVLSLLVTSVTFAKFTNRIEISDKVNVGKAVTVYKRGKIQRQNENVYVDVGIYDAENDILSIENVQPGDHLIYYFAINNYTSETNVSDVAMGITLKTNVTIEYSATETEKLNRNYVTPQFYDSGEYKDILDENLIYYLGHTNMLSLEYLLDIKLPEDLNKDKYVGARLIITINFTAEQYLGV